jgi:hypothetical protein
MKGTKMLFPAVGKIELSPNWTESSFCHTKSQCYYLKCINFVKIMFFSLCVKLNTFRSVTKRNSNLRSQLPCYDVLFKTRSQKMPVSVPPCCHSKIRRALTPYVRRMCILSGKMVTVLSFNTGRACTTRLRPICVHESMRVAAANSHKLVRYFQP